MAARGTKVQKVMVQPINLIFRYLQNRSRIQIWLYENVNHRIEGYIIGKSDLVLSILVIRVSYIIYRQISRYLSPWKSFTSGNKKDHSVNICSIQLSSLVFVPNLS